MREKKQKEAEKAILESSFNGILDVSPRFGKSKVLIDSIRDKSEWDIVIICPFIDIINSWKEEINKWNLGFKVRLLTQRSLSKIEKPPDLLVCDEIHTLSDNQLEVIKELKPKRIVGLSGSISDETRKKLKEELDLNIIYKFSLDEAIDAGIISDYEIFMIGCNLDYKNKYLKGGSKKKPFMTTEYANYNYLTKQFNRFKAMSWSNPKLILIKMGMASKRANLIYTSRTKLDLAKRLITSIKERCLVFTSFTDIADKLCEYSYHSKSKGDELDLFKSNKIKKLAVAQKVSMGKILCPCM